MIIAPIFLVFRMYIWPTWLLEDHAFNAKFYIEGRFHLGSTSLNWNKRGKIKKAIAVDKDDKDEEDHREKYRQVKREKQH